MTLARAGEHPNPMEKTEAPDRALGSADKVLGYHTSGRTGGVLEPRIPPVPRHGRLLSAPRGCYHLLFCARRECYHPQGIIQVAGRPTFGPSHTRCHVSATTWRTLSAESRMKARSAYRTTRFRIAKALCREAEQRIDGQPAAPVCTREGWEESSAWRPAWTSVAFPKGAVLGRRGLDGKVQAARRER
jgi:hypothetical protein